MNAAFQLLQPSFSCFEINSLEDHTMWRIISTVFPLSVWKRFVTNLQLISCLQLNRGILRWGRVTLQTSLTHLILAKQFGLDMGQVLVLISEISNRELAEYTCQTSIIQLWFVLILFKIRMFKMFKRTYITSLKCTYIHKKNRSSMLSINICLVKILRFNLVVTMWSELKFGSQYLKLIISFISF